MEWLKILKLGIQLGHPIINIPLKFHTSITYTFWVIKIYVKVGLHICFFISCCYNTQVNGENIILYSMFQILSSELDLNNSFVFKLYVLQLTINFLFHKIWPILPYEIMIISSIFSQKWHSSRESHSCVTRVTFSNGVWRETKSQGIIKF